MLIAAIAAVQCWLRIALRASNAFQVAGLKQLHVIVSELHSEFHVQSVSALDAKAHASLLIASLSLQLIGEDDNFENLVNTVMCFSSQQR